MARGDRKQSNDDDKVSREELERYREASEDLMQQLDWAIGYLHGIRKSDVSTVLAKNRSYIRRRLLDKPEQPLPTQETEQT
jgi:hypothetical protein